MDEPEPHTATEEQKKQINERMEKAMLSLQADDVTPTGEANGETVFAFKSAHKGVIITGTLADVENHIEANRAQDTVKNPDA